MKIELKHASFIFVIQDGKEYEVRIEKQPNGVKDFNIFKNGQYKTTYPMRLNANQSNAKDVLEMFLNPKYNKS